MFQLAAVDLFVVLFYFVFVLAVGWLLKSRTRSGEDFFLAGRSQSYWVAGISFIAASMGALELMGWSAATYQYGLMAVHWYWIGVVPGDADPRAVHDAVLSMSAAPIRSRAT